MTFQSVLQLIISVASSFLVVIFLIFLGWFFIWKAFLSKFRLVREILGQINGDPVSPDRRERAPRVRKIRRD